MQEEEVRASLVELVKLVSGSDEDADVADVLRALRLQERQHPLAKLVADLVARDLRAVVGSVVEQRGNDDVAGVVAQVVTTSAFCRSNANLMRLMDEALGGAASVSTVSEVGHCGAWRMVPEWVPGDVEGLECLVAALRSPDVGANPIVAHTMLQALLTIPIFWIRRPREETEALVAIALDLLLGAHNSLQSVAILDASATWFRNMFASQFGRQIICDQLQRKLLKELRDFVKRLPLDSELESASEVANATAAHNVRCCGFLLESSRGRKVLRETFSTLVPEDGVDNLLTAMVSRMVGSTKGTDPVADAVRDVLLGLCREDQCVYKPSVLAALTSAPENDRAVEVLAAIAERPWPTDTPQDFPERLALFVAAAGSPSAPLARITCRIFASTLTIPEGTVMDVASASVLCATPLGSLACARLAPSAVASLFARYRLDTPDGEYGEMCWSVLHGLSQLGGVMPAIGSRETKVALVQELKLCTEGLAERMMAVAETRSSGNSQRPCTDGKLDRAIERLLLTLTSLLPSFPESLELFEPKESTKLWTLISCVLGGEIICEAAYIVALRLLCLLARDLDLALHLMTHAGLKEALASTKAIVDESSVLRNHLVVLVSSIGGPSEKLLPPKTLSNVSDEYTWPMVTEDAEQLREYFVAGVKCSTEAPEGYLREFVDRLRNGEDNPADYIEHCKAAFEANILSDEFRVPGPWCGDIFEAVIANGPCPSEVPKLLFEYSVDVEHSIGANLATEYGVRLGLLKEADSNQLASLMSHLRKTQMPQTSRFDWLAATMYLLLEGDVERTWSCVYRMRTRGTFRYLTEEVCAVILYHNAEMILGEELPTVLGAFQVCGVSVSSVCSRWLGQCFWNVLSWGGICQWLGLQLFLGEDMAVYHLVFIFAHMKEAIVDNAAHRRLAHFAMEVRIEAFEAGSFLGFIKSLEEKYQDKLVRSFKC